MKFDPKDEISLDEFNKLAKDKKFVDGPWKETFGDGYGEPYNPNRRVYGTLTDRVVWAWLSKE